MSAVKDLEDWLEASPEKVRRNATIETPESLGLDYLLHISSNTTIRKFVPLIGRRQAQSEDRTVPRITCATSLLGCLIGYAKADDDFMWEKSDGEAGYKGGWKIYGFPFEAALKPNNKLVFDASNSDETWLTAYNRETAEYVPEALGKLFVRSMTFVGRSGKRPAAEMELFIEITAEKGIAFSKNRHLDKGYWKVEGPMQNNVASWKNDRDFKLTKIDRAEYLSAKVAHADLLSLAPSLLW